MDLAVQIHQQRVDREVPAPEVLLQGPPPHFRLARVRRVGLGPRADELDQAAGKSHLGRAEALEDDRRGCSRQLGESPRQLQAVAPLDHDIRVRMRPLEHSVANVAAHDPGRDPEVGGSPFEQPEQLLLAEGRAPYWLIRAHSTAPTCPARSPSRARRRRGRRAGLMKGDERRVSRMVG